MCSRFLDFFLSMILLTPFHVKDMFFGNLFYHF
ncbi:Uncharacterised protein [Mycobacteroides abscessus subsp. abscessus]|nr:Uncharacterised protein [Mycobacteroides abscessus subsp. abscessus]